MSIGISIAVALLLGVGFFFLILFAPRTSPLFKLYMMIFENTDYQVFKQVKRLVTKGEGLTIWRSSEAPEAKLRKGIYGMVCSDPYYFSIWKDDKVVLSWGFATTLLKEILKAGHLEEVVDQMAKDETEYVKQLHLRQKHIKEELEHLKQLSEEAKTNTLEERLEKALHKEE